MTPLKIVAQTSFFATIVLSLTPGYSCDTPMIMEQQPTSLHLNLDTENAVHVVAEVVFSCDRIYDSLTEVKNIGYASHSEYLMLNLPSPIEISYKGTNFKFSMMTSVQSYEKECIAWYSLEKFSKTTSKPIKNKIELYQYFGNFSQILSLMTHDETQRDGLDVIPFACNSSGNSDKVFKGEGKLYFKRKMLQSSQLDQLKSCLEGSMSFSMIKEVPLAHPLLENPASKINIFDQIPALLLLPPRSDKFLGTEMMEFQIGSLADFMKNKSEPVGVFSVILAGKKS